MLGCGSWFAKGFIYRSTLGSMQAILTMFKEEIEDCRQAHRMRQEYRVVHGRLRYEPYAITAVKALSRA